MTSTTMASNSLKPSWCTHTHQDMKRSGLGAVSVTNKTKQTTLLHR